MTNEEVRPALLIMAQAVTTQAQAMTAQANKDVRPRVNANESSMASRLRDFSRMNPPEFLATKVEEDPQRFVDEVSKILSTMGLSSGEKGELASYQLKDLAQIWYEQWKGERPKGAGSINWEVFKEAFLDRFFSLELREQKLVEFMNLRQGGMSVKEYSLKFT
ncbi:uncharacterized protein LOC125809933 [Solanum verrucosum]|uniref:uncharacterized protein LOC125809933 n=1 Tax=Solanum verrucosum TaxID=315347 RepID=UPI0020D0D428|nr:uncharacterized protein LOC125809933 [Solanum verrucosum]